TPAVLGADVLSGEGLAPQATADIKGPDGKTVRRLNSGLALVAAAPMSDANERTIGAIYGGVLMNHFYDIVDETTKALGGKAALLQGDAIVSSTIPQPDGTRIVDAEVAKYSEGPNAGKTYLGPDSEGGTTYLARIDPILDDQNNVVGARWYGVPMSVFEQIQNHTTVTLVMWGLVATIIALLVSIPIVTRLSRDLAERSRRVSEAAGELGVIIVGSEVSGDHVAATKAAVERSGKTIADLRTGNDVPRRAQELATLNDEIYNDVVVIDTLAQEMNGRMKQAVDRVAELKDVAGGLNKLVTGNQSG
ncbi:MAG: cache domain-containing protein, partial [Candidatus Eremiobacteraeota bacterium]|nr:cache domain-containing protein [Candidatus Eremiobacteraeota bacterium]